MGARETVADKFRCWKLKSLKRKLKLCQNKLNKLSKHTALIPYGTFPSFFLILDKRISQVKFLCLILWDINYSVNISQTL